jgi:prepilin-type processing-associated H-X9-DG protein
MYLGDDGQLHDYGGRWSNGSYGCYSVDRWLCEQCFAGTELNPGKTGYECKIHGQENGEIDPICDAKGVAIADHQSYWFTGQINLNKNKGGLNKAGRFRLAGDNDLEGDEGVCGALEDNLFTITWTPSMGCGWKIDNTITPEPSELANCFWYVGGLEEQDNHGTNGVNVLYYDWHVEFDSRSWPSPIGWLKLTEWSKAEWDLSACSYASNYGGCKAQCPAEWGGTNVVLH